MKKLYFFLLFFLITEFLLAFGRNITGSTGYLVMPVADGMRFQEYDYGLSVFSKTKDMKEHWKFYGGLGTSEGTEISIMGRSEREGLFLNMKWFGTLGNYEDPLLVGIGFENVSSLGTFGDYPNMFMVVTKKFLSGTSFSIGSTGRYIGKEVFASMMVGLEIYTSESLSWLLDMVAYEDNRYNGNAGLRIYSNNNTYFDFCVINAVKNNTDPDKYPTTATMGMTMIGFM